jgi:hypothetical protein
MSRLLAEGSSETSRLGEEDALDTSRLIAEGSLHGSRLISDVNELAGRIGSRGTGTAGERAAADYVAGQLAALGLPVSRTEFRATSSQNAFPAASAVLALMAVALYRLGGVPGRWIAAGLALAAGPLLWRAIRLSGNLLQPLLPKVCSGNVVGFVAPGRKSPPHHEPAAGHQSVAQVVLLAHLDTNRTRLAWRSGAVRWLEPMTWLTLGMLGLLGLIYACGALVGSLTGPMDAAGWAWYASLLPAAYATGMLVTLTRDEMTPFSPGAHDNAASVAVALETARGLVERPLESTEVVLAFTGAEETDHAGLYALLGQEHRALRAAAFVGLEGLGSGRLVYLAQQGLCDHVRPDPGLLAVVEKAAARRPDLMARPGRLTEEDDVTILRRRGYRAICIAGCDPATGTLPRWHRPDDTAESVSPEFLWRSASFVRTVLDEIDGAHRGAPPSCAPVVAQKESVCELS